jgi:hypothetical protein
MNRWTIVLVLLIAAACSQPPVAQPPTEAAPAPAAEAPKSEAITRADALLEDFRRREAAQAKYDRENPPPRFVPIPKSLVDAARTASASAAPNTQPSNADAAVPVPVTPTVPPDAAPARNEMWWKRQMESLQTALDQELVTLAAMEKMNMKYGYNDAQAMYKKQAAAVANARQAIERLRDEARRAGVPPGWLRP